jgi:tetratricopeptide (TPR) repeat protein
MSDTELRNRADQDWNKKETVGRFIRDILIVAVVLAAGFGFYWKRQKDAVQANKIAKEAKDLILLDNPKDFYAAEKKLQEVLGIDSSHGYALSALAEIDAILAFEHKVGARKADAEKYAALAMDEDAHLAEQYSAKALVDIGNGKVADAEKFIQTELLDKNAGAPRVFNAFGKVEKRLGKLDIARRSLKGAQDSDWRNPRFAADLAENYLEDGDLINALVTYGKGLNSNPDHLGCKIGKARVMILRGEGVKEAGDILAEVLAKPADELTPNLKARAITARAEMHLFEGALAEAIQDADAAAAEDPSYAPAYMAKALALARGKDAGAAAAFDKAIAADPNVALFYYDASSALILAGLDQAKALSYLEKYPLAKDDRYYVKYGDALRGIGRIDDALVQYNKAIEENGLNAAAHLSKALVLMAKNTDAKSTLEEAQTELDYAVGAQETYPDAYLARGQLQFMQKKYVEGAAEYAQALQQLRALKAPRERLTSILEMVKQEMIKAKEKDMAKMWDEEASALIR